jgi:hypothetical protein
VLPSSKKACKYGINKLQSLELSVKPMNVVRLSPRASAYSLAIAAALALISKTDTLAQVSYTVPGVNYLQDFNTLPLSPENTSLQTTIPWTDNSTSSGTQTSILGWYLYHPISQTEGGISGRQRLRITPGTSTTGSFYSFGSTSSSDRALGSLGSNTMSNEGDSMHAAVRINNNTGLTLTDFTVTYNGEQWRNGGSGSANSLLFAYSLDATPANFFTNTATFTSVAALNFTSPVVSATGAAVDGNNAGRVNGITATVSGISWAPGTDLWLRWSDVNNLLADDGIGIDDLTFSAIQVIPEPSGFALAGLGIASLLIFRRRK